MNVSYCTIVGYTVELLDDIFRGCFFFFFKQKTAYEIGTGDWSSDVCSSVFFSAEGDRGMSKPSVLNRFGSSTEVA